MGDDAFDWGWLRWVALVALIAGFGFGFGAISTAHAQDAAASAVRGALQGLAGPAFGIGVVWFGYLTVTGQASMQLAITFIAGATIVFAGGFL